MDPHSVETSRHLAGETKAKIRALGERVHLTDQALALVTNAAEEPGSSGDAATNQGSERGGLFLVANDDQGAVRAVCVVDLRLNPPVADFVADPELDNRTDWVQLLVDELRLNAPAEAVATWNHDPNSPVGQLAGALGWQVTRQLVIMNAPTELLLEAAAAEQNPPQLPAGWTLRAFDPATDEEGWLDLNRTAFVDLPDQAAWTLEDLRARYEEPWFDAEGFLVLLDDTGEIQGAHWTKLETRPLEASTAESADEQDQTENVGEVYVLAVAPGAAGRGFGALLTTAGINHLAAKGASRVYLYVDSTNTRALCLYRKQGFTELARDTQYLAGLGHV